MKRLVLFCIIVASLLLLLCASMFASDIRSAGYSGTPVKGKWNVASNWLGGVIPGPTDNVTICDGDTLYIIGGPKVNDLTVGDGTSGALMFASDSASNLTVAGTFLVNPGATFREQGWTLVGASTAKFDTLFLYGDFFYQGVKLDFRSGSAPAYGVCCVYFTGSKDNNVQVPEYYNPTTNRFGPITVNKSGNGRVILLSDVSMASGNSVYYESQPYLDLIHGLVQTTDDYALVINSTSGGPNSQDIIRQFSKDSYIVGCLGRAMASGDTSTRFFPIGDDYAFRPVRIKSATAGVATGAILRVHCINGDPNPSGNPLPASIDKLSNIRYYQLTYAPDTSQSAPQMSFDRFYISYGVHDGVSSGNSNLRTAYFDTTQTWFMEPQTVIQDTTRIKDTIVYWHADYLPRFANANGNQWVTLKSKGKSAIIALARAAGTLENSLVYTVEGVRNPEQIPSACMLAQNYPNPFNPSTEIRFTLPHSGQVVLEIYNTLGQFITRLVDENRPAGSYVERFSGNGLSSGVYFYRLHAGSINLTKSMILTK